MSDSPRKLSRRAFLGGLALGAASAAAPGAARASDGYGKGGVHGRRAEELCTFLDISRCINCQQCVYACRETNGHKFPEPKKPFPKMYPNKVPVEDWSERRNVTDRLTPYNWLSIQTAEVEWQGKEYRLHIPRRCLHCQNPPCANLCPFGAARKLENGIVRIESGLCMGGAKCRAVCPWHIPQRQTGVGLYLSLMPRFAGNGVMYKCDRCFDTKVAKGELPACVEVCPESVQSIGPREEIVALAKRRAGETGGFLYGLEDNGGTNTIYLSPVPWEVLNEAVDSRGKHKPDLAAKPNVMANEENLASAVFAAPVAGLAAGVFAAAKSIRDRK